MSEQWVEFTGSAVEWNQMIFAFANAEVRHSFEWGEQLRICGRRLSRYLFVKEADGKPQAAVQFYAKQTPLGIDYYFSEGGVVGDLASLEHIKSLFAKLSRRRRWYFRAFFTNQRNAIAVTALAATGFRLASTRIHSGLTVVLEIPNEFASLKETSSGNWRHNLSRGLKRIPRIEEWKNPEPDDLVEAYRTFEAGKGLSEQFSREALDSLVRGLGDQLLIFRALDEHGKLLSMRGAVLMGDLALDLFAATTPSGRECYASHAVTDRLVLACKNRGVKKYDFAGIDPVGGKGVYTFKRGTGALPYEYLGEWDLGSNNWIRILANLFLGAKVRMR